MANSFTKTRIMNLFMLRFKNETIQKSINEDFSTKCDKNEQKNFS